jgi:hypothetical protein
MINRKKLVICFLMGISLFSDVVELLSKNARGVIKKARVLQGNISIEGQSEERVPQFRVYYNGMETISEQTGEYSFPVDDNEISDYGVLITKNVDFSSDKKNTISNLFVKNKDHYRFFSLTSTGTANCKWRIREKKDRGNNFIVPERTIVITVNPKSLKKINTQVVDLSHDVIPVPSIILSSKDLKHLQRQSIKSQLYSLDMKQFHQSIRKRKKHIKDKKCDISLPF